MAGERPDARRVVVPPGSAVIDSMVDVHPESGALYRSVLIHGPVGIGTVELMVPIELAPLLSAAFAGRPVPMPGAVSPEAEAWIRATTREAARRVEAETVWPAGDLSAAQLDGTACVRCGGSPSQSTPVGRVAGFGQVFVCSPTCPRTSLYRVVGDDLFGDLVIEVPPAVAGSGSVASWLAERASLMIRHQIGGEYAVDVTIDLPGGFVAVSVDGTRIIHYSLVEASRTEIGGAS